MTSSIASSPFPTFSITLLKKNHTSQVDKQTVDYSVSTMTNPSEKHPVQKKHFYPLLEKDRTPLSSKQRVGTPLSTLDKMTTVGLKNLYRQLLLERYTLTQDPLTQWLSPKTEISLRLAKDGTATLLREAQRPWFEKFIQQHPTLHTDFSALRLQPPTRQETTQEFITSIEQAFQAGSSTPGLAKLKALNATPNILTVKEQKAVETFLKKYDVLEQGSDQCEPFQVFLQTLIDSQHPKRTIYNELYYQTLIHVGKTYPSLQPDGTITKDLRGSLIENVHKALNAAAIIGDESKTESQRTTLQKERTLWEQRKTQQLPALEAKLKEITSLLFPPYTTEQDRHKVLLDAGIDPKGDLLQTYLARGYFSTGPASPLTHPPSQKVDAKQMMETLYPIPSANSTAPSNSATYVRN